MMARPGVNCRLALQHAHGGQQQDSMSYGWRTICNIELTLNQMALGHSPLEPSGDLWAARPNIMPVSLVASALV